MAGDRSVRVAKATCHPCLVIQPAVGETTRQSEEFSVRNPPDVISNIIDTLSTHVEVSAVALGGSRVVSGGDADSDYDVYVFVDAEVDLGLRRSLAERFDSAPEIGNSWFGPGDEWRDRTSGAAIDLMFWERQWFEERIRDVIELHMPSLGYTTSFWYTLRHAIPLFDRGGWLAEMRQLAATPYPDTLQRNIVAWNHPLLRTTRSSYRHQLELAVRRDDPVSMQHRVTALLASIFDIVFALNRALHPGEKRLLAHAAGLDAVPDDIDQRVRALIRAAADPDHANLLAAVDALCDTIDEAIRHNGLAHIIEREA